MEMKVFDILEPVNGQFFDAKLKEDKQLLFNKISFPEKKLPEIGIALLGIGDVEFSFREALYSMYYTEDINIADLGNLPVKEINKLVEILKVLTDNDIFTVLIGDNFDASAYCFDSLTDTQKPISASFVLPAVTEFPYSLNMQPEKLFNINILGYQTYLSNPEVLNILQKNYFGTSRLGNFRENNKIYEPTLRDSDLLSIDIASVRRSDAPDSEFSGVNGLYSEEICLISYFAGNSPNLRLLHLFCRNKIAKKRQISELFGQIVWHIADGFAKRKKEKMLNNVNGIKKMIVKIKAPIENLVFYHSDVTNRWWLEILSKFGVDTRFVACNREDYELAKKGIIPDKLIWYQEKMLKEF